MLFNSLDFAVFLPLCFVLYWFFLKKNLKIQNLLIVCASYLFYGWWDWRFLFLILFSTIIDFRIARMLSLESNQRKRKVLLYISIIVNLGFLGFFKYYNFFLDSFISAFTVFGIEIRASSLDIILPVGISFYTFQTLSYTIDVYKKKLTPTKDYIAFSAFVCFFPQLVAGPIERATNLLPQFLSKRKFNYVNAVDGLRQILWGLFKKIVIADNCAEYANAIFNHSTGFSGPALALGALFFSLQIYGDFSGYSDIAIGTSRLFGFKLKRNFAFPYFSRDIAEFWRRWHISLSTWFRDYLYIPLGGSRGGRLEKIRNTFLIFVVSGFWHGANWTFIAWGALHACYFLPLLLIKKNRNNLDIVAKGNYLPSLKESFQIIMTFGLVVFAWIFFRAENLEHALQYSHDMLSGFKYGWGYVQAFDLVTKMADSVFLLSILLFLIVEWKGRERQHALFVEHTGKGLIVRWSLYFVISLLIFVFQGGEQEFMYFQF